METEHMSSITTSVLISIKPRYVQLILASEKTVELRKRSAQIQPGTRVMIYSTSPRRAIVGEAIIAFREQLPLPELWRRHGQDAAVTLEEFNDYYAGADQGVAFGLEGVQRYPQAVSLDTLRDLGDGFRPPQSYMRIPSLVEQLIAHLVPLPAHS